MSVEAVLEAVRALPPTDQRIVVETILDELGDEIDDPPLTDAEKEFIDRRLAAHRANPERVRPFEEVLARIEAKLED